VVLIEEGIRPIWQHLGNRSLTTPFHSLFQTSTAANSWAAVALWRRFFEIKGKEEEDKLDELAQIFEEEIDVRRVRPVAAPEVIEARQTFSAEHFRELLRPQPGTGCDQQTLDQPNLRVPVNEDFLYRAQ
jgi:hypothetical protein